MRRFDRYVLYLAWLIATGGCFVSLYFSFVQDWDPCDLCWYQRICLFPLPLILGIATYRNFFAIGSYALSLSVTGLGFALYQVAIQEIPGWNPIHLCGRGPSCTERLLLAGPITVPMGSAALFFILTGLLFYVSVLYKQELIKITHISSGSSKFLQ